MPLLLLSWALQSIEWAEVSFRRFVTYLLKVLQKRVTKMVQQELRVPIIEEVPQVFNWL